MTNLHVIENTIDSRVRLHGHWDVNYWAVTLGCSVRDLTTAIGKVGSCPEAISEFLKLKVHHRETIYTGRTVNPTG